MEEEEEQEESEEQEEGAAEAEARALRALGLARAGDPTVGRDRRGFVLLTCDYGYPVPSQEAARRALAELVRSSFLPSRWAHEVRLDADENEAEVRRYGDPSLFPSAFVRAPRALYRYVGPLTPAALRAAIAAVLPLQPAPPQAGGLCVLGTIKAPRMNPRGDL